MAEVATAHRAARWVGPGLLVAAVAVAYGAPFVGIWVSLLIPFALHRGRRQLWGSAAPRRIGVAVLVWVGLWLPAISYTFTGWYWALTGRDLSTAWLLLPLCGPDSSAGLVVPAIAATAVFAAGLVASILRRQPWLAVAGAWLAPWAHDLAFSATTAQMIC
ncbi:hypothetical protein SAMN04488543_1600 [Friedmanniella luteola]|uniref:Apolipoprotein N-acyltransferase n=1 Tax=Friedmanniella luteola TaxID=546871 RepID=A0A1H1RMU1_9ACTN|nr:hypothetical protein [Friedmanniella luteola]SDS37015.1 hypothetical protein SAMN04488543_1600 [Friedmanniella luteola]